MAKTLQQLVDENPDCDTFRFGDGPELCARLLNLVRSGRKTATCEDIRAYTQDDDPFPEIGRRDIALNWDGTPALMIETTEVTTRRFCDVDEAFALAEGEDETLAGWQAGHRDYFERNFGFSPEMKLMCERFRLIEDYA